ncbi:1-deoxy-D-xylulose-5-phosphate reductoisomerase [Methylovirgula sp. 4M-Z18]|uniref:1-deoxy-D-xylulose-5-phosphate reductoisomerase n=1 Tax=Methylovirgula sp. 4M-Z18 TaxID=2293567 RepID=UPI000E2F6F91|nr:1-deoxy-D-xylulose-5-phosphate reductoisomerase [Methylovirgula sp. 4M-Z18]RFB81467.1 1-deoxy-D-xylulose-5-phosphate reductoisomerase [Methylovirgula sp. 4M-Z18]
MRPISQLNVVSPIPETKPKSLVILGATGSVGRSTADVIAAAPERFAIDALVGGRDAQALAKLARKIGAKAAVIADPSAYSDLKAALAGTGIAASAGAAAVNEAATRACDLVVAAISGTAGVVPTHAALAAGRNVALANKESLVCAGTAVLRAAAASGAHVLPMDSEHNAIFQALGSGVSAGRPGLGATRLAQHGLARDIAKVTITASGGPFRTWGANRIGAATPEEALAHPNYAMGPKITVDSASLMNKGLELIEAHVLFGIPADQLDVLVHPQQIFHGLVSFTDGSVVAGLAHPDMRVPIAHCLAWPERMPAPVKHLNLATVGQMTFEAPDLTRFPALGLAIAAMRAGEGHPTALNAANEVAVAAFLRREIGFSDIPVLVENALNACARQGVLHDPETIADALALDRIARERAQALLATRH